ncbi:hypothetical protein J6590_056959, partial [Homalodisca vitripennis]
ILGRVNDSRPCRPHRSVPRRTRAVNCFFTTALASCDISHLAGSFLLFVVHQLIVFLPLSGKSLLTFPVNTFKRVRRDRVEEKGRLGTGLFQTTKRTPNKGRKLDEIYPAVCKEDFASSIGGRIHQQSNFETKRSSMRSVDKEQGDKNKCSLYRATAFAVACVGYIATSRCKVGCLQDENRSAVTNPRSSLIRRFLTRISCE